LIEHRALIPDRMHTNPSDGGGGSPLRFLLPRSILARRLVIRGVVVWAVARMMIVGARQMAAEIAAPPPGFSLGWKAAAVLIVAVTAVVVIVERRRGVPPLLLANLGTPPAAGAAWVGGTVLALEVGGTWLL
jgi:hypothetical protein